MSNLTKKRPLLSSLFDDDVFSFPSTRFFNTPFFREGGQEVTVPAVNIKEQDDRFEVELAAPVCKKEDLKVDVENNVLTISSEQKDESEEKKDDYTRREFSYSSFRRSFTLPEHADADKLKAKFADGVLKLSIPKRTEEPKPNGRSIAIE